MIIRVDAAWQLNDGQQLGQQRKTVVPLVSQQQRIAKLTLVVTVEHQGSVCSVLASADEQGF